MSTLKVKDTNKLPDIDQKRRNVQEIHIDSKRKSLTTFYRNDDEINKLNDITLPDNLDFEYVSKYTQPQSLQIDDGFEAKGVGPEISKVDIENERIKKCVEALSVIEEDSIELFSNIKTFPNDHNADREYIQIDDMLLQSMIRIDDVNANGNQEIRLAKRKLILKIKENLAILEAKKDIKPRKAEDSLKIKDVNCAPVLTHNSIIAPDISFTSDDFEIVDKYNIINSKNASVTDNKIEKKLDLRHDQVISVNVHKDESDKNERNHHETQLDVLNTNSDEKLKSYIRNVLDTVYEEIIIKRDEIAQTKQIIYKNDKAYLNHIEFYKSNKIVLSHLKCDDYDELDNLKTKIVDRIENYEDELAQRARPEEVKPINKYREASEQNTEPIHMYYKLVDDTLNSIAKESEDIYLKMKIKKNIIKDEYTFNQYAKFFETKYAVLRHLIESVNLFNNDDLKNKIEQELKKNAHYRQELNNISKIKNNNNQISATPDPLLRKNTNRKSTSEKGINKNQSFYNDKSNKESNNAPGRSDNPTETNSEVPEQRHKTPHPRNGRKNRKNNNDYCTLL